MSGDNFAEDVERYSLPGHDRDVARAILSQSRGRGAITDVQIAHLLRIGFLAGRQEPVGFTWQMAPRRTWACRLLAHGSCRSTWKVEAVTYVNSLASGRRTVDAHIACPCSCHGTVL